MKVIVFVVLAMFAACAKGGSEAVMEIVTKCKAEVGATDDDLASLVAHAPPSNQAQKCMFSCMMSAANVIKDGKLQVDGFTALANIVTGGDPGKMKIAADIFEECKKLEGDADPCEAASKIGGCTLSLGAKSDIIFVA